MLGNWASVAVSNTKEEIRLKTRANNNPALSSCFYDDHLLTINSICHTMTTETQTVLSCLGDKTDQVSP